MKKINEIIRGNNRKNGQNQQIHQFIVYNRIKRQGDERSGI